ncbi:MAG: DUF2283 domain-containing protein [Thermoprotei archaeon]|jgi:uncharacterized protein YuzE|uniref:DUF2283 domain-containing protein n=1 Tax=Fervidicoccus fontis TaxID=683846 RepID=A0A7J3SK54_9CREN|nr:DUF2283 domain-containing protein [Thermoprotei archaeon]
MGENGAAEEKKIPIGDLKNIWFEYDSRNDILYINFGYDIEEADEEILLENDIVVRIKKGNIIGMTVFDFSKKIGKELA